MRHSVVNTKSKNLVRRMTYLYDNVKSNLNMAMTRLTNRILENNMYIATIAYTVQSSCGHRVLEKSVSHSLGLLVQSVWLLPNDSINKRSFWITFYHKIKINVSNCKKHPFFFFVKLLSFVSFILKVFRFQRNPSLYLLCFFSPIICFLKWLIKTIHPISITL